MDDKQKDGVYRIGSYAKHLGVTPDFLKHYESHGLIHADTAENGYRYYPFHQTYRIFECMKLRNLSVPVRHMNTLLNGTELQEIDAYMTERAEAIRRHIRFEETVLRQQDALHKWLARMQGKHEDWSFLDEADFLFLPHTIGQHFISDPRVYDILSSWTGCMPLVKSCQHVTPQQLADNARGCWGLIADSQCAAEIGLSVNDAVEHIHVGKSFLFFFSGLPVSFESDLALRAQIVQRLCQMGMEPTGDFYSIMLMSTHIDTNARHYGYYLVPLK